MPRQNGTVVESNFIKGLITETTGLRFPTDACTETWNCIFDETGRVTRREGIDIETNLTTIAEVVDTDDATSEFLWSYISSYTDGAFVVQQQGSTIFFFDVTEDVSVADHQKSFTIDLSTYSTSASINPGEFICQYAQGTGRLIIVNPYTAPLIVEYSLEDDDITVTETTLQYRDFAGLDDGLAIDARPTETVASLTTNNPEHLYNIINQGWYAGDALTQWDTARTDMPSNADAVSYSLDPSATDLFDSAVLAGTDPGNSPAPKGHFILEVGVDDREAALASEGYSATLPSSGVSSFVLIPRSTGTGFSGSTLDAADRTLIFDSDDDSSADTDSDDVHYLGKNYSSSFILGKAVIRLGANNGAGGVIFTVYGSNSLPANDTDGTVLGTTVSNLADYFSDNSTTVTVVPSTFTNSYTYFWVRIEDNANKIFRIHYLDLYQYSPSSPQPRAVSFFSSRVFYAGILDAKIGSNIYFSQLIEDKQQFGRCYQANDPTSIEIADLLATDGGVIKIPDMGTVYRLFNFQNQLLIFAANGTWSISGPSDGPFSATGYVVRRLSSIGMTSPQSVIDVRGLPVWWAEDGIYTVKYDANYGSTVVEPISENNIKSFLLDIPEQSRKYVKGAYDRIEDIAYWLFDDTSSEAKGNYSYNKVLCMNAKTGAFFPWEIEFGTNNPPTVKGILYVQDGLSQNAPSIKLFCSNTTSIFYSEFRNDSYQDWTDYAESITADEDDEVDYESYFVSGYRVDGDAVLFLQAPYIYWYLEPEAESFIYTQALYDWTTSGNTGKWSTRQVIQCRPLNRPNRELGVFRRKYRGKGRAMQVKVQSETGKPFTLLGWAIFASASTTV